MLLAQPMVDLDLGQRLFRPAEEIVVVHTEQSATADRTVAVS
jgi:hypothetical protein